MSERTVTFLPDPATDRPRPFTVFSVDDHLVEPPDVFTGRVAARFRADAPRVVEVDDGSQQWLFEGRLIPNIGLNAVSGRPRSEYSFDPVRFDEMRPGAWDPIARLADMDLDGVWASVCFPSFVSGFAGRRLTLEPSDPDLAFAAFRAYNDWHLDVWTAADPERLVAQQLPWLRDPVLAAEEIRRNAARGFRAVSFPDSPHALGLPTLHSGAWDPFLAACEETDTVICLHFGSSGDTLTAAPDAPPLSTYALTAFSAIVPTVDWLFAKVPVRFPRIRIVVSEGGISWVAGLLDRLDHADRHSDLQGLWDDVDLTAAQLLQRNFWFCFFDDPSAFGTRHRIGIENLLAEVDYPHADSTWPFTQDRLAADLSLLSDAEIERVTWRNASELFRHAVPASLVDAARAVRAERRGAQARGEGGCDVPSQTDGHA